MHIAIGTLVLIKLHKNADFLGTKANCVKDRKVHMDKNKLRPRKEWMPLIQWFRW